MKKSLHGIWTYENRKFLDIGVPDVKIKKSEFFFLGGRGFIRELVRIRDKHTCQKCGKKWQEGKRRFDVHHIDSCNEGKSHRKGVVNFDKKNFNRMITLCHKCHLNLDIVREKMSKGWALTKR